MLKRICSEVGQGVMYLVLQKILNYSHIHKLKGYDKPEVEIFAEVCFFCKQQKAAITTNYDSFDIITIVIILDILHSDFKVIIANIQLRLATRPSKRFRASFNQRKPNIK